MRYEVSNKWSQMAWAWHVFERRGDEMMMRRKMMRAVLKERGIRARQVPGFPLPVAILFIGSEGQWGSWNIPLRKSLSLLLRWYMLMMMIENRHDEARWWWWHDDAQEAAMLQPATPASSRTLAYPQPYIKLRFLSSLFPSHGNTTAAKVERAACLPFFWALFIMSHWAHWATEASPELPHLFSFLFQITD